MSITPQPPLKIREGRLKHGSILNGNIGLCRVSSQWQSTVKLSTAFKSFADWISGEVRAYMRDQVATHVDLVQDVRDNDFEQTRFLYVKERGATYRLDPSSGAADDGDAVIHDNVGRRYLKVPGSGGGGDISGPASSTDGGLALWDGTDGDKLKDGPAIGTSGASVPLLNGNNVWDGSARFNGFLGIGTNGQAVGGIYFHRTESPFLVYSYGDPNAPTNIGQFRANGANSYIGISNSTGSTFGVAYTPANARVGILTSAPAHTLSVNGIAAPLTDNAHTLGASGYRWSVVWAATGTISTSDARDKDVVDRVGEWATDVVDAVEPALYRWLVGGNEVEQVEDGYDEEEQYVFEETTETVDEISVEDGRAVVRSVERIVKRQVFDEYPVVDEAGAPVMVGDKQAVHRVPRVEIVQIPRYRDETVPVAGQRLHAGWLAQEVRAALDAAGIDCGAWGLEDAADPDSRQWVRPDQMTAILWAALRETRQELTALRAQIEG